MHKATRSAVLAVVILGLGLAVSSCTSSKEKRASLERNPAPCPNILVLNEAGRQVEFDGEQKLENVAYSAEITKVSLSCRYFEDKPIVGSIEVDFALGKGPKATSNNKEYTYFVAITRRDVDVIAKREFTVKGNFSNSRNIVDAKERIKKFVIPRADGKTSGSNFEIVVGLSLTREQAIFNRSGKSLKFPNL